MVTVRQVQPGDWKALRSLRLAALREAPQAFSGTLADAESESDASWHVRAQQGAEGELSYCAIALWDEEPIGMAVGLPDERNAALAYLAGMWVAPGRRRTGVGAALVDAVAAWAGAHGRTTLYAGVLAGNAGASSFYRRIGFEVHDGAAPDHWTTAGHETVLRRNLRGRPVAGQVR